MSWRAHKTKSQRKIITMEEWATHFGISRHNIYTFLKAYKNRDYNYDPTDAYSLLEFELFIVHPEQF